MKALKYIGIGIVMIAVGVSLDKIGAQNWPSEIAKWWDGPPIGSSELALGINEALDDVESWRIATKDERDRAVRTTCEAITNGKIIFTGVCQQNDPTYRSIDYGIFPLTEYVNLRDCLSPRERVYLFKKSQSLYNKLRYEKCHNAFKANHGVDK